MQYGKMIKNGNGCQFSAQYLITRDSIDDSLSICNMHLCDLVRCYSPVFRQFNQSFILPLPNLRVKYINRFYSHAWWIDEDSHSGIRWQRKCQLMHIRQHMFRIEFVITISIYICCTNLTKQKLTINSKCCFACEI